MSNGIVISNTFFEVTQEGHSLRFPYFRSQSIDRPDTNIELLVLAMHGSGVPDAHGYLNDVLIAANAMGATSSTLVIAPQLANLTHLASYFGALGVRVPADVMWGEDIRFIGGLSGNSSTRISFFTAIDQLLEHIIHSGNFPNLSRVVVVGHSAGGQLVNTYAASSRVQCLGLSFRYVILNPSHYVYFSDERWVRGTSYRFAVPTIATRDSISACADAPAEFDNYNNYGCGLDNLFNYHNRNAITADVMRKRYEVRNIVHLIGMDTRNINPNTGESRKCHAMLQGDNRLERWEVYRAHIQHEFGSRGNHHFDMVPGVGHNGGQMINSPTGQSFIFEEFDFPTMKTLADYQLIRDSAITLQSGGNREFQFVLPDDAVGSGHSKRPILSFFADPSGSGSVRLTARMNGSEVFAYTYSGGVGRVHWEAFTHDHLRIGASNTLLFSASGRGTIHVSDIILWYQREIC